MAKKDTTTKPEVKKTVKTVKVSTLIKVGVYIAILFIAFIAGWNANGAVESSISSIVDTRVSEQLKLGQ